LNASPGAPISPAAIAAEVLVVGFTGLLLVAVPGGGGSGAALSLPAAVAITGGSCWPGAWAGSA